MSELNSPASQRDTGPLSRRPPSPPQEPRDARAQGPRPPAAAANDGVPLVSPRALLEAEPELAQALQARAAGVLRGGQYVMGPEVEAFERDAAPWIHARFAIGVTSGSDALLLALAALGVGPGDQVVVPAYTFVASAGSVARLGARPRFVDSCGACLTMLAAHAASATNAHTRALMPVHLFGQGAAMAPLYQVAQSRALAVVEDAAQSFGLAAPPPAPASVPWLRATSFFPSKNLGGCGDAGLLATDDETLLARVRMLRVHGSSTRYLHEEVSGNYRLDALQAALLQTKLTRLPHALARRRANAAHYGEAFARAGAADAHTRAPCTCAAADHAESVARSRAWQAGRTQQALALPYAAPRSGQSGEHTYNQYVVQFASEAVRERVARTLAARGIAHATYYPIPLHLQPCFAHLGYRPGSLPVAEQAARTSLALPIAEHLTPSQLQRCVDAVLAGLAAKDR